MMGRLVLDLLRSSWSAWSAYRERCLAGGITKPFMLGQRRNRAEALSALAALDLDAAVGVHALVPAQVRELGVRLEADFALERLHRRVDVGVLLESGRGGERLAALETRVTAGAHVMGPNMALKIRRIREYLGDGTEREQQQETG